MEAENLQKNHRQDTAERPNLSTVGYIHSVDSCGTVDGPGVRFIVFTTGCPLRCLYCHNPDTRYKEDGAKRTVGSLIDEIGTYAEFIKRAGGGLTVSGGEPLVQNDFVRELFIGVKERFDMHTALDTSGDGNLEAAESLLEVTDLVLLDIKSWNPETYREVCGRPIEPCLQFAKRLHALKQPTWVRFVLVPGLTDAEENIAGLARFLKDMDMVERIELLSFHKMGEYKWDELGLDYKLKDVEPPSAKLRARAKEILETSGHPVIA